MFIFPCRVSVLAKLFFLCFMFVFCLCLDYKLSSNGIFQSEEEKLTGSSEYMNVACQL